MWTVKSRWVDSLIQFIQLSWVERLDSTKWVEIPITTNQLNYYRKPYQYGKSFILWSTRPFHCLQGRHFPSTVPPTLKKAKPQRRCLVCQNKYNKRKDTTYMCMKCDVGLCPVPCFEIYHTQEKYFWIYYKKKIFYIT